ncbi:MAG: hypothetical protein HKM94_04375 [Halobacteria archaeon]|nr:hypothetical protein [Halobacteria archaeon]
MKHLTRLIMSILLVPLVFGFATGTAGAVEKMPTTTANVKVLLDNDQVKVVEALRPPGTKVPMHTHPAYIAYFFSPCKMKLTSSDGKTKVKEFKAGQVVWSTGKTHAAEVLGTADQHVLLIELKK